MRVHRIDIAGFGRLRGTIDLEPDRLTIVAAPNAAGKSTLAAALAAGLAGGTPDDESFRPWDGPPFGVTIQARTGDGQPVTIERTFDGPRAMSGVAGQHPAEEIAGRLEALEAERSIEEVAVRELSQQARALEGELAASGALAELVAEDPADLDGVASRLEEAERDLAGAREALAASERSERAADGESAPAAARRLAARYAALDDADREFLTRYADAAGRLRTALEGDRDTLAPLATRRAALQTSAERERRALLVTAGVTFALALAGLLFAAVMPSGRIPGIVALAAVGAALCGASLVMVAIRSRRAVRRDRELAASEDDIKGSMRSRAAGLVRLESRLAEIGAAIGVPAGEDVVRAVERQRALAARLAAGDRAVEDAAARLAAVMSAAADLLARAGRPIARGAPEDRAAAVRDVASALRLRRATAARLGEVNRAKARRKARLAELVVEGGELVAALEDLARGAGVPADFAGDVAAETAARTAAARRRATGVTHDLPDPGDMAPGERVALARRLTAALDPIGRSLVPGADRLEVGEDFAVRSGARPLSGALGELAQLALRIAFARVRAETGEAMPLVLDEPLLRVDDDRFQTALRFLARDVVPWTQVVLLTAQAARVAQFLLDEPGAAARVAVVELPEPVAHHA